MFKKAAVLLTGLIAVTSFTGCATILKKKSVAVKINSEPQGADVFIRKNRVGRTPLTVKLSNRRPAVLRFQKDGFEDVTYTIDNHLVHGWAALSLVCAGPLVIVDLASKSAFSLDEDNVNVTLDPKRVDLSSKGTE